MLARISVALVIAILPLLASITPAAACSCISRSINETVESSDGAFVGRVVASEFRRIDTAESTNIPLFINTFEIETVVKGDFEAQTRVHSPSGSGICGLPGSVTGGDRYGFYTYTGHDGHPWTSLCMFTDADSLLAFAGDQTYPPLPVSFEATEQSAQPPSDVLASSQSQSDPPSGNGTSYNFALVLIAVLVAPTLGYALWRLTLRHRTTR